MQRRARDCGAPERGGDDVIVDLPVRRVDDARRG
jgi:hypothetical protein